MENFTFLRDNSIVCWHVRLFGVFFVFFFFMCSSSSFISLVKLTAMPKLKGLPLATLRKHSNTHFKCINWNPVYKILISLSGELWGSKYMSNAIVCTWKDFAPLFWCPQNTTSSLLLYIKNSRLLFSFPKVFLNSILGLK